MPKPTPTPSMTIGPFFAYGLLPAPYGKPQPFHNHLCGNSTGSGSGSERICIGGRVLDRDGAPIDDALIEIWQADAAGRYPKKVGAAGANFRGHGRAATDKAGAFYFYTVKPGRVDKTQAPHINVVVCARGLTNHMFTRFYFDDEAEANAADRTLQGTGSRKHTLIAARENGNGESGKHGPCYRRDIKISGKDETVFFDI